MNTKMDSFVTSYLKWLTENIKEQPAGNGWTEIATPFLDCYNDGITVYAHEEAGSITLSDDGVVASQTICLGGPPSRDRLDAFCSFLRPYGIDVAAGGELTMAFPADAYPIRFHLFLQAVMSANDIFSRPARPERSVRSFLDEIIHFFDARDVAYSKNVKLEGQSGIIHEVGFIIPKRKHHPERLVYAINKPNRQSVELALFNWSDIQKKRGTESNMIAFLNDADKKPSTTIIQAFRAYEALPVPWSMREAYMDSLAV